ncbi:MAG TPA: ergothioneine biosynthesis protein EgtB [Candidatus Kapabacteria bacterium]|jgi:ergothioneine biosynthesis protein EgtB|nr:ergothioneine biosynthesis protein EgtB [Candidatus Kapabacteria bacterium]
MALSIQPSTNRSDGNYDRKQLLARYHRVREITEKICEPLAIEDCVIQTSTECSPVKWHLAHTSWFFETFILKANSSLGDRSNAYQEFHPTYGFLFNSYYNTIGDRTPRPNRGLMSRPTMDDVRQYRAHIDRAMEEVIAKSSDATFALILPILILGLNHEQQHQELIVTDVKTVLGMNPLRPVYRPHENRKKAPTLRGASPDPASLQWMSFDEGLVEVGAYAPFKVGDDQREFYFDNEGPQHRQYLERFQLADRLITNAEYKAFITDGGYRNPALWLSDGWAKRMSDRWEAPHYWELQNDEWWNFTLHGFRPVNDAEPVTHISYYEADAYATWYGARLATEFEWEHAALSLKYPVDGNFLDNGNLHPVPSASLKDTVSEQPTLKQMFGDAWEWTRSAYLPYPGYKPTAGALGEYNGKFMSNQMVLRGGSCVTPRDHIRITYRNFFPPEARWQFSGIRLARSNEFV